MFSFLEEWVFEVVERITMDVQGKTIETNKKKNNHAEHHTTKV